MAHYATTLTSPSSTTWATLMLDWLQSKVALESGWSVVKHNVAVGTEFLTVIKCANGPVDFYIGFVRYTTNPAEIAIIVAEDFITSTNKFVRPAVVSGTTVKTSTTAADFSVGATEYTVADTITNFSNGRFRAGSSAYPRTNSAWNMSVFSDGLWLMCENHYTNPTTTPWAYIGFIDSLVTNAATNDPVPLVIINADLNYTTSTSSVSRGGSTRSAMNANAVAHDWFIWHSPWLNDVFGNSSSGSTISSTTTFDKYAGTSKPYAMPAFIRRKDFGQANDFGYLRGESDRMIYAWLGAPGDILQIGSDEYMRVSGEALWLKKAV